MESLTLDELNRLYTNEPVSGAAEYYAAAGIVLPSFVRDSLDATGERAVISYADGVYRSTANPEATYAGIEEAYDAQPDDALVVLDNSLRETSEQDLKFLPDERFLENDEEALDHVTAIFGPVDEKGNRRWLSNRNSDEDRLVSDYVDFLIAHEKWKQEKDVATAWDFVAYHPVFWHKMKTSKRDYWTLENGWEHLTMGAYKRDGKIRAYIDAGGYDESNADYTQRYADVLLEVVAPSMDEAIIALANQVELVFGGSHEENPGFTEKRNEILDKMLNRS